MKAKNLKNIFGVLSILFFIAILVGLTAQFVLSANNPVFISDFDLDDISPVNEDTQSNYNITGQIFPLNTQPVSDYNYAVSGVSVNSDVTIFTTTSDVFVNATFKDSGSKSFTLTVTDKVNATYTHSRVIDASVTATDSESFFTNGTQTVATFNEDQYTSSTKQSIDLSTLIDNDGESDSISYSLISGTHNPQSIVCEISGSTLTYYPAKDFFGSATCGVQSTDANSTILATSRTTRANPTQTTFNFNVNAQNDAPEYIASSTPSLQNITFTEDTNHTLDLTLYFKDVDGNTLTYTESHTNGINKVTFSGNTATIEPVKGFDGLTTLVINANDGTLGTPSGTLNVNITGINNAVPQFNPILPSVISFAEGINTPSGGISFTLSSIFTDEDSDFSELSFSISDVTTGINAEIITNSLLYINSKPGFNGIGKFTLTVSDGLNANIKIVQVNVTGVNQAPSAPVLVSPLNGSTVGVDNTLLIDLVWNASTDLDSSNINYTAFVYETQNPSVNQTKTTTDTKWQNVTVKNNVGYTWYVDASDGSLSTRSSLFTFTPVTNFKPVIQSFTPDISSITIKEGESINFTTKVNDTENDSLKYSWKIKGTEVSTEQNYTFITGFQSSGNYDLIFSVNDGNNTVSRLVNITVTEVGSVISIASKTPSDNELFMAQGTSQQFSVVLNNTNNVIVSYIWALDGKQVSTSQTYVHKAPSITGTQTLKLTVSSGQQGVSPVSSEWKIETRNTPISRSGKIGGSITGFSESQLASASGVTLDRTDIAKIDFGNQVIDLRSVIDLDNFIVLENNLVGIDSSVFSALNKPATITIRNLAYDTAPKIFRSGTFTKDSSQVTSECTTCNIVSFTPAPTSSGTVTFTVPGFSTYKIGNAVSPDSLSGLIIERLEVDGKRFDPAGGTTISDIKPGENIKVEVKVKNNFEDSDDPEIQDVQVELFVLEIDNRDDIEEESETFDLEPRRSQTVDFDFDVTSDVEHGREYKLIIEVSGTDEDNKDYVVRTEGFVKINKERHDVHVEEFEITPEVVRCSRAISVDFSIKNRGRDRERDAAVKVVNDKLGINRQIEFNLDEDPDNEDFEYDQSLTFTIPESVVEGDYEIALETYYDDTKLSNREVRTLTVGECQDQKLPTLSDGGEVVVNVPTQSTPLTRSKSRISGMSDEELLLIIVLAGIALILLTLVLIIVLMPKKTTPSRKKFGKDFNKRVRKSDAGDRV